MCHARTIRRFAGCGARAQMGLAPSCLAARNPAKSHLRIARIFKPSLQAASAFPRNAGQRGARPTQAIAHAAGWDAGNRVMRAAGRTAWNEDDWDAACEVFNRLMRIVDAEASLAAAQAAAEAPAIPKRRALRAA